jgi:hypothetical protein
LSGYLEWPLYTGLTILCKSMIKQMSYFCFEIVWQLDIQLPTQSVSITTNTTRVEVYSMQHYVIKFVSDL